MITNADMTLYNKVDSADGPLYYRTHLYGVNWQDVKKSVSGSNGLVTEDRSEIFVPAEIDTEKSYVKPVAYKAADKTAAYTFAKGDVIVRGIVNFEITSAKDSNLKVLQNSFDDVMTITSVATLDHGSLQHFELEAKA